MNESVEKYADIIHLPHHRSTRRAPMSRADRAAQFSSFAALSGHSAAIQETARLTETPPELSDSAKAEIDACLRLIAHSPGGEVLITYYVPDSRKAGGACITLTSTVRKLREERLVLADGREVPVSAILALELV